MKLCHPRIYRRWLAAVVSLARAVLLRYRLDGLHGFNFDVARPALALRGQLRVPLVFLAEKPQTGRALLARAPGGERCARPRWRRSVRAAAPTRAHLVPFQGVGRGWRSEGSAEIQPAVTKGGRVQLGERSIAAKTVHGVGRRLVRLLVKRVGNERAHFMEKQKTEQERKHLKQKSHRMLILGIMITGASMVSVVIIIYYV